MDELLRVERAHRRPLVDERVHARLREGRLVGLVVSVAPVAHEVDDDVLVEGLAELERQRDDAHGRFGVVAVHVEDRRLHHLGDVRRVHARAAGLGSRREPELVVHDDVHGAADVVARDLREVERLGDDALAGERRVTVDEHGQHGVAGRVAEPVAAGPRHPLDDGVDGFEVRRVRRERERDVGAGRGDVLARGAEVVLHVTGTLRARRVELTLELAEDLRVRLADDVREDVEAAAVGHPHDDLVHALVGGRAAEPVEHGDQRLGAFEAESLLAEILRVQEALERLGGVEPIEDAALVVRRRLDELPLDPRLDPVLLLVLLDVHVLDADRAGVRVA